MNQLCSVPARRLITSLASPQCMTSAGTENARLAWLLSTVHSNVTFAQYLRPFSAHTKFPTFYMHDTATCSRIIWMHGRKRALTWTPFVLASLVRSQSAARRLYQEHQRRRVVTIGWAMAARCINLYCQELCDAIRSPVKQRGIF